MFTTNIPGFFPKRTAFALLASMVMLSACGGGGDAGSDALPDSITITALDGPSGGQVGQPVSMNVKVTTTGGIGSGEITYKWEQSSGVPVIKSSQGDGNYESTLSFTAGVTGSVTFKVTVTARDKTSSQSKSVPINP